MYFRLPFCLVPKNLLHCCFVSFLLSSPNCRSRPVFSESEVTAKYRCVLRQVFNSLADFRGVISIIAPFDFIPCSFISCCNHAVSSQSVRTFLHLPFFRLIATSLIRTRSAAVLRYFMSTFGRKGLEIESTENFSKKM